MVARRLKAARFAYMENGAQFARQIGVTAQVLNAYEKARNYPDQLFILKFCEITGCPADWLICGRLKAAMPPCMAAKIGANFPDLILDEPRRR